VGPDPVSPARARRPPPSGPGDDRERTGSPTALTVARGCRPRQVGLNRRTEKLGDLQVVSPAGRPRPARADPAAGGPARPPGRHRGPPGAGGARRRGGLDPRPVRRPGGAGPGYGAGRIPPAEAVLPADRRIGPAEGGGEAVAGPPIAEAEGPEATPAGGWNAPRGAPARDRRDKKPRRRYPSGRLPYSLNRMAASASIETSTPSIAVDDERRSCGDWNPLPKTPQAGNRDR
jgi:hypothetical protein